MSKPNDFAVTIPTILAGVAGEYFVAAELSRRGFIASISLRNTRGIDIIVTNQSASRSVTIQCKTNQLGKKSWVLNDKSESYFSKGHFYVFVVLGKADERPNFHIVPSEVVAKYTKESHDIWLKTPGAKGQQHVGTSMRKFSDLDDKYLDRWDLLALS